MSSLALRRRWSTPEGRLLRRDLLPWLAGRGDLPEGLSRHDGRIDLRGLELDAPAVVGEVPAGSTTFAVAEGAASFSGVRWLSLDFTEARLPHLRFTSALISDCVFEEAECRDWRLWDSVVDSSSFTRARLRDSAVATWHEGKSNRWQDVSFDAADLRGAVVMGGAFRGCTFRDAKLDGVEFQQSAIEDCVFSGPMRDVAFDGRGVPGRPDPSPLHRVSFAGAAFQDVEFRGCQLSDVEMPADPAISLIANYPAVARRALAAAEQLTSVEARMLAGEFRNALRWPGTEDSVGVFNRRDYLAAGGEALADLAEALLLSGPPSTASKS